MLKAPNHGLTRVAFVLDSAVTRLQMQRLSAEIHMVSTSFFTSEVEAFAWLLPA